MDAVAMPEAQNAPILSWDDLFRQRDLWKKQGRKVVFTNGVFDLLHRGHLDYLRAARQFGDVLVVGANTDSSVRRFKEPGRPLIGERDRAFALSCLRQVDAVALFDQDTPLELISRLKPDVLVKGADYEEKDIVGAKEVRENGGQVVRIALTEGRSTTDLIQTILQKHGRA
jgi:rfaE bifunctional protein nucleotidyltransferase chain/domain